MKTKPYKYEISKDGKGLIAYCDTDDRQKFTYHIHFDELTKLEKWIKSLLDKEITNPERRV